MRRNSSAAGGVVPVTSCSRRSRHSPASRAKKSAVPSGLVIRIGSWRLGARTTLGRAGSYEAPSTVSTGSAPGAAIVAHGAAHLQHRLPHSDHNGATHNAVPDVELLHLGDGSYRPDVRSGQPVTGMNRKAELRAAACRLAELLQRGGVLAPALG